MASIVDRGDSYHVIYLGSCMLTHMSTGLGVLQKPLRELYFKYRQAGGGPAAQERHLVISGKGMTMTYKDSATAIPTQAFYGMPNILFWDSVQFCGVRGPDKKIRGAFEPIDNDHSRNKDNLFSVLEKKYHFLQQMTHPPLFTCVLRRTAGVKALDVHAFVCSSDEEGLSIVKALHTLHNNYKSDESTETGVFGYKPFTGGAPGSGVGMITSGGHPDTAAVHLPGPDVASDRSTFSAGLGQRQNSVSSNVSRSGSSDVGPSPSRPFPSVRRPGGQYGQVQVLPTDPQSQARLNSYGQSGSISSLRSLDSVRERPKVHQLTQHDFLRGQTARDDTTYPPSGRRDTHVAKERSPEFDNDVYDYIGHSDDSSGNTLERTSEEDRSFSSSPEYRRSSKSSVSSDEKIHNNNGSIERESLPWSKSRALVEDTLANQHNQISDINNRPVNRVPVFGAQFNKDIIRSFNQSPIKQGQNYRLGSGSDHSVSDQRLNEISPRTRLVNIPQTQSNIKDFPLKREPPARPPARGAENSKVSREDLRGSVRNQAPQRGSPFGEQRAHDSPFSRSSPTKSPIKEIPIEPPVRPVAKVPPHISTGVRVLPPTEAMNLKSTGIRSPEDRPKTFYDDHSIGSGSKFRSPFGVTPRRARSQYFDDPQYMDGSSSSSDNSPVKAPPSSNWAFGKSDKGDGRGKSGDSDKNNENSQMNEKLLLSKKKDAEIASVLHNLRFDYDNTTMSPGLPAGNNFEKSLGYFP